MICNAVIHLQTSKSEEIYFHILFLCLYTKMHFLHGQVRRCFALTLLISLGLLQDWDLEIADNFFGILYGTLNIGQGRMSFFRNLLRIKYLEINVVLFCVEKQIMIFPWKILGKSEFHLRS